MNERELLLRAVKLAEQAIPSGGGPFGAVIVRGSEIISESVNRVTDTNDPTAHAEILAIRSAAQVLSTFDLSNCILYSSCEPCPMCLGAIYWAGIKTVVFAAGREDAAEAGFDDENIYNQISLHPEKREVRFKQLKEVDGIEPFRIWKSFEGKIHY